MKVSIQVKFSGMAQAEAHSQADEDGFSSWESVSKGFSSAQALSAP